MHLFVSRRTFLGRTVLGTGTALVAPTLSAAVGRAPDDAAEAAAQTTGATGATSASTDTPSASSATGPSPSFPTQDPALVREMVIVAHGNLTRVQELVGRQPTLARATYDWGFGDWESALGAASHVGRRDIAEYLLANGARPSIFSAAMLGQLEVVKAFVAASPGVQRTLGPHGITLLAHAKAGGDQARAVVAYLEALGDADPRLESAPLSEAEIAALAGTYVYGPEPLQRIAIEASKARHLGFTRATGTTRGLLRRGEREFSPVGAPNVRIRFAGPADRAVTLTVHDPDLVLTARREA